MIPEPEGVMKTRFANHGDSKDVAGVWNFDLAVLEVGDNKWETRLIAAAPVVLFHRLQLERDNNAVDISTF